MSLGNANTIKKRRSMPVHGSSADDRIPVRLAQVAYRMTYAFGLLSLSELDELVRLHRISFPLSLAFIN